MIETIDIGKVKLGRNIRHDPRTFPMARYLDKALPEPPSRVDWTTKTPTYPMFKNNVAGNCTVAGAGHMIQVWTSLTEQSQLIVSDEEIMRVYCKLSGYDPVTGANDNGLSEVELLNFWRNEGIGGRKIGAFVSVDTKNTRQVKQAISEFGGVYIGVALPKSAQQTPNRWSVPFYGAIFDGTPGSWGGHCVVIPEYDEDGNFYPITWGQKIVMTGGFWNHYVDEAYAIVSPDWLDDHDLAPNGFNMARLVADLPALRAA